MKVIFANKTLHAGLQRLQPAINNKTILPVLEMVHLNVQKKKATITATNLNVTISADVECEANKAFKLLLPFSETFNITKVLADLPIEIEMDDKHGGLTLSAGFDVFKLGPAGDPTDYPKLEEFNNDLEFEADAQFFYAMQMAAMTRSGDNNEMVFNNVCIKTKKNVIDVVGSDRRMLFLQTFNIETSTEREVLVDGEFMRALKTVQSAKVIISDKFFCVREGNTEMYVRVTDQKYAKYEVLLPATIEPNCSIARDEFKNAISKIMVYKSPLYSTNFLFGEGKINLNFQDVDFIHEVTTEIPAEHSVDIKKITLNAVMMQRLLSMLPGECVKIKMNVTSDTRGVFFLPDTDDKITILVMPIFPNS